MTKILGVVVLLGLVGCAGTAYRQQIPSPCASDEASYACQVERYHNVNAD